MLNKASLLAEERYWCVVFPALFVFRFVIWRIVKVLSRRERGTSGATASFCCMHFCSLPTIFMCGEFHQPLENLIKLDLLALQDLFALSPDSSKCLVLSTILYKASLLAERFFASQGQLAGRRVCCSALCVWGCLYASKLILP